MGLAASQARLLLLTARKSDLEYRAQQITNSLMILAMQTEEVAREYSLKISNQTIKYIGTDQDQTTTEISLTWLATHGYTLQKRNSKDDDFTDVSSESEYTGPEILEGYNNGTLRILDANGDEVTLSNNNGFTQTYYTDDDRQAEAEYNEKTASIQVKEKRLQNDLTQVETQQKACDTEIDSVKKIMEKNIERTFKVFS